MGLKIGIVGASCTGKTTLATKLSKYFNLEVIGEIARELFQEFNIASPRELINLEDEKRFQQSILDAKRKAESNLDHFVADRTFIDAAAYWLFHLSQKVKDEESYAYFQRCRDYMNDYNIVIFLPYDRLGGCLVNDGVRTGRIYYNYAMHLLMEGMLADWNINHLLLSSKEDIEAIEYVKSKIEVPNERK